MAGERRLAVQESMCFTGISVRLGCAAVCSNLSGLFTEMRASGDEKVFDNTAGFSEKDFTFGEELLAFEKLVVLVFADCGVKRVLGSVCGLGRVIGGFGFCVVLGSEA